MNPIPDTYGEEGYLVQREVTKRLVVDVWL